MKSNKGWLLLLGIVLFLCILIANIQRRSDQPKQESNTAATTETTSAEPKIEASSNEENVRKAARENYISGMREEFRNNGIDASISDIHGRLILVWDQFKTKPNRDEILRRSFGPRVRRELCAMGFKTIALRESGVLLGEGDEYSVCPETKEEKQARREEYIASLHTGEGIQVSDEHNEIAITGFAHISPQMIRATWKIDDQAEQNLCGMGFRGLRVKADANSRGTFISFRCGGRSNE